MPHNKSLELFLQILQQAFRQLIKLAFIAKHDHFSLTIDTHNKGGEDLPPRENTPVLKSSAND